MPDFPLSFGPRLVVVTVGRGVATRSSAGHTYPDELGETGHRADDDGDVHFNNTEGNSWSADGPYVEDG